MLIALGVTGGIGAYKAVEVARGLQKRGHEVVAVMTHSATRFVGVVTFEAITRRHVITDQFETGMNADIEHIALASTIDLLLIAPATANCLAKAALGLADDLLSTMLLTAQCPLVFAPAPLQNLGMLVQVEFGQLTERFGSSLGLFLSGGVCAVRGVTQCSPSELASVRQAKRRVGAKGHPSESGVVAIDYDPRLLASRGDPEAEP